MNEKGVKQLTGLVMQKEAINKYQLANLYKTMHKNNDIVNAFKIADLYEKKLKRQFFVNFTGHFSAGKSSLINYLLQQDLLPKSPIPTSANIVKITSGLGVARVFFHEEHPVEYAEPYDIDMIKDFCMSKDTIKEIEIQTSDELIPHGSYIVDTPGIDAADDADRYMTESSLHMVDVLFYVMDYNHVQSEVNLNFLKQVQSMHIPINIIINQIDKHNEAELSFESFKKEVKSTFTLWDIKPINIYYSTTKDMKHPHNELKKIKADLFNMLENNANIDKRITEATNQIIDAHLENLQNEYTEKMHDISLTEDEQQRFNEIKSQMDELEIKEESFVKEYTEELNQTLKNAYLMPAKLRDYAKEFLESQQHNFKIGFFQSKKKTETEKQLRLEKFFEQLEQTIQSTMEWKLREKFVAIMQKYGVTNEKFVAKAQQLSVNFLPEHVITFIKEGATINGNYVLNYTNELSADIKQKYKHSSMQLLELLKEEIAKKTNETMDELSGELAIFESKLGEIADNQSLQNELNTLTVEITEGLNAHHKDEAAVLTVEETIAKRSIFVKGEIATVDEKKELENKNHYKLVQANDTPDYHVNGEEVFHMIDEVTEQIADLPSFQSMVENLQEKQDKIKNRNLSVALFGAFSAGKSSFSNALLGNPVLPVSPNPTTAVINRITPVTKKFKHGTVVISYKSDELLTSDIKSITKDFYPDANNFKELVAWFKQHKIYENDLLNKTYQSYLLAILTGFEQRKDLLGKSEIISLEQFAEYVTNESIAAYIAAVDLYYDCPLTKKGITLVDTPGADSVNARHTNVAFDYIKDADAILYVTYYNHAVTSADRDFLLQLGRVKESFELDKMFFIVNAADLAENKAELQLVVDYVNEQLLQYGIRNPRIYPLSSKNTLQEKLNEQSLNKQMESFEKDFYHFIEHELQALTYEAACWDMELVKTRLEKSIQSVNLDALTKQKHIEQLQKEQILAENIINNKQTNLLLQRTEERIERQLHFVMERFYIRFHEMFSEHFNPTTITENGRRAANQLEKSRNQLVDYVGYELLQEIRAVSLRLESFSQQFLQEFYSQIRREIEAVNELFTLSNIEKRRFETPEYEQALKGTDLKQFTPALKIFKNTRQFFEQNDREQMKELFYELLKPEITEYVHQHEKMMKTEYKKQIEKMIEQILLQINVEIKSIIQQQKDVLQNPIDVNILNNKLENVRETLRKVKDEDIAK